MWKISVGTTAQASTYFYKTLSYHEMFLWYHVLTLLHNIEWWLVSKFYQRDKPKSDQVTYFHIQYMGMISIKYLKLHDSAKPAGKSIWIEKLRSIW